MQGAGGAIVSDTEAGNDAKVDIDSDAGRAAAEVIKQLADSPAAQPDFSVSNEGTSLGQMFPADGAGEFMTNWTFVYKNYEGLVGKDGGPADEEQFEDLGWARYPATVEGEASKPPIGGIDIGVGAYSKHPEFAMEAGECITSQEIQVDLRPDGRPDALHELRLRERSSRTAPTPLTWWSCGAPASTKVALGRRARSTG